MCRSDSRSDAVEHLRRFYAGVREAEVLKSLTARAHREVPRSSATSQPAACPTAAPCAHGSSGMCMVTLIRPDEFSNPMG